MPWLHSSRRPSLAAYCSCCPSPLSSMILGYSAQARGNGREADGRAGRGGEGGGDVAGIGLVTFLSALVLVSVRLAPASSPAPTLGARLTHRFENSVLGRLPQYQVLKSMAEGLVQLETVDRHQAGADQHRGCLADGLPARAARERLASLPSSSADTDVRQRHVLAGRPRAATRTSPWSTPWRSSNASAWDLAQALRGVDLKLPPGQ